MAVSMKSHRARVCLAGFACASLVALSVGCETRSPFRIRPGPVVKTTGPQPRAEALSKVAVMPFYPATQSTDDERLDPDARDQAVHLEDAAFVGRLVSDALISQGVAVIAPSDLERALVAEGLAVPQWDPKVAAEVAARVFGASSVLLGRVIRYQGREGIAAGAARASSVAFEVSLHEISTDRRPWSGRFEETQQPITENIFRARDYPGGGTRWLTAAEFARWGADHVVAEMLRPP